MQAGFLRAMVEPNALWRSCRHLLDFSGLHSPVLAAAGAGGLEAYRQRELLQDAKGINQARADYSG